MMDLSSVTSIALSGMQAQTARLSASADNLANSNRPDHSRMQADTETRASGGVTVAMRSGSGDIDPAEEMRSMLEAGQLFAANAAAFESGADLWDMLRTVKRD